MESFLQLNESEGNSLYIKHSFAMGKFVTNNGEGDEPLQFEHLLIHPDFLEGQAFDEAMGSCWKDKVEGKVPCFKYLGSEKVSFSGGASGFKAKLEYVKWVDKPADFDEPSDMGSSEARAVKLGEGGSGEFEDIPF